MNPKLVIFDLDGTLLDTLDDLGAVVNYAMSQRGFAEHTRDEYMKMVGDSDTDMETAANSGIQGIAVSLGYRDIFLFTTESKITARYPSPIGEITLVSDGNSLTELQFEKNHKEKTLSTKSPEATTLQDFPNTQEPPVFTETRHWLDLFFSGIKPDFTPPLNPQGTQFQQKVWRELLTIPYGQTTTYGAIAKRINCRSAQAVGQAIHRNPIAIIIPCHRVIGSNGSLTGYAAGLGIKQQLLTIEKNNIL